jgi:HK97 family phage major capsid protein
MEKKEIMSLIDDRRNYAKSLENRAKQTVSTEHKRAISETLKAVRDEINDLEKQLTDTVESDAKTNERSNNLKNALIRDAFGGSGEFDDNGFRTVASYGKSTTMDNKGIALRSNESMVSRLTTNEQNKKLDLGVYVRGALNGFNEDSLEKREFNSSNSGVIIPQVLSAQIIDMARNISLFTSAEVPVVPMQSNNMTFARIVSEPTVTFKEEMAEAGATDFDLDAVELKTKTAYAYTYVSNELLESASNLSQVLYEVFAKALADCIDKGFLYGQYNTTSQAYDTFAPSGILNDEDINVVNATNVRYNDFIKGIGAIKKNNGVPSAIAMNSATDEELSLLCNSNGDAITEPKAYSDMPKIITNQLAYDEEKGSDALVFNKDAMVIGMQNVVKFRMVTDSDECVKRNATCFVISANIDCATVQPKHITKITGIKDITVVEA